jgi:hypothetical protein
VDANVDTTGAAETATARFLGTLRLGMAIVFVITTGVGSCICFLSH